MIANPDIQVDLQRNIVYITINGRADRDTFRAAFYAWLEHPLFRKGMNRCWDLRNADVSSLTYGHLESLGNVVAKSGAGINDVKAVFVVGDELTYGKCRMFKGITDLEIPGPVFVAESPEEAEAWLSMEESLENVS